MHRLEWLAIKEAKELRNAVPELWTATECFRKHMLPMDWDMLQSFNDKFKIPGLLEHFFLLRNWLIDSWNLPDWEKTHSSMTTKQMREEAEAIAKRIKKLSRDLEMLFPGLCSHHSIHTVIDPVSWVRRINQLDRSNTELPQIDIERYPIAFDPRLATNADSIEADSTESESEPVSEFDLRLGLSLEAGEVAARLRRLSRRGLTPGVAGQHSILDQLHSYITQEGKSLRAPPIRRKHPIWCRYATFRLANKIDKSDFFQLATKTQKHRVIEYSILAAADYYGLEPPSSLDSKEITRYANKPP